MAATSIRPVRSIDELARAIAVVRVQFDPVVPTDDRRSHDLYLHFDTDRDLCLIAENDDEIVGGALGFRRSSTEATLRYLAVRSDTRGMGIGQRLVRSFEIAASRLGIENVALGAEDAADFYMHCGWRPMLILQWVHDAHAYEAEASAVLEGPAAGLAARRSSFNGVPQLFVKLRRVDREMLAAANELAPGAHAGFTMTKDLR
jgi:N-acetylglutamate synthase-like GNAT family acetyltransferase